MTWRSRYRRGSFRGVPFYTSRHDSLLAGRRVANHEYPSEDDDIPNYPEDVGSVTKEFTFDSYLLGEHYDFQRNALEAACNQRGTGTLVHPYRGSMEAICTSFRVVETSREGGIARIALTFLQGGRNSTPQVQIDHGASVATALAAASTAVANAFNSAFRL